MQQQHFLDFARVDVGAAADDHVLAAVLEREESVLVQRAHVTGEEPAVPQGCGAGLGIAPIAGHDRVAAHQNFTDFAQRERRAAGIRDPDLDRCLGHAY